jgi:predicted DNA-binding transcriptional regulator YafY
VALPVRRPILYTSHVCREVGRRRLDPPRLNRKIHLDYRDARGEKTERAIEPQYLLLSYPVWYVAAWDDLRREVRIFRCDRIERARLLGEPFRPRRFTQFESAVEAIDAIQPYMVV